MGIRFRGSMSMQPGKPISSILLRCHRLRTIGLIRKRTNSGKYMDSSIILTSCFKVADVPNARPSVETPSADLFICCVCIPMQIMRT
jgi:hypothetical protein